MLFIKLSLKKRKEKKKKNRAASDHRRVPDVRPSVLFADFCDCTESDLSAPRALRFRPPCLVRSRAASVLVLLVTFDLWVSRVSVFLCLFLDLVVFCSGLLGRGLGGQGAGLGPAPAVWGCLCPAARPLQPPPCPRLLGGPSPAVLGFACVCQVWADAASGQVRLGVIPGSRLWPWVGAW